jgi:hypothetical protein
VAAEMNRLGLRPGDRIASLEYSLYGMSTWARLTRAKIVSEVYYAPGLDESAANDFWNYDPATQAKVIQALEKTGARVIVSRAVPPPRNALGWRRVGNSGYYAYWLSPPTSDLHGDASSSPATAPGVVQ